MENKALISLGSNLGDRYRTLQRAVELLHEHPNMTVVASSSIYDTEPVGYEDQDVFLNMVVEVLTSLDPENLLVVCNEIEHKLGRVRDIRWGPRTVDLDILLYNEEIIQSEKLIIPHPRMHERAFVLIPLLEILSDIRIPTMAKSLQDIVENDIDREGVRIWKQKNGEDVFALFES